jgi:bifunctional DNA-binding transcriptional regulator/antitoxin component of YhaV-PrlF toxin-antitoxin module
MSLESTVGIAKVGTRSLRATVPEGIAAFLGIQAGDKLQWKMDIQNNKRVAIVNKKSNGNDKVEQTRYSMKQKVKKEEYQ